MPFVIGATREASQIWSVFYRHGAQTAGAVSSRSSKIASKPIEESPAVDPATGWQISPVVAASLCMKPTRLLTPSENAKVTALKKASPSFVVMRQLAMRFRSILRGEDPDKLNDWLRDLVERGQNSSVRACFLCSDRCDRK